MSFNVIKLGQLLATLTDYHANGAYKALKENVELLDTPDYALMIRTTNFENDDFTDSVKYISKSAYDFLSKSKVYPTDIIMNKIANAGSVYLMPDLSRPVSLAMNLFLLRVDNNKANPIYVYIFLKINESYVKQFANGSVTKTITKDAVRNLDIVLPPRTEQDKIARSYQIISNKINNNNKINQTLEQMAQALFKSWFVDFEPVKAKITALEAGGSQEEATLAAMTAISGKEADVLAVFEREHPEQYAELKATAELFPSALQDSELGEIPEGWTLSEIGEQIDIAGGATPSTKAPEFWDNGDIHWTTPKDLSNVKDRILLDTERKITKSGLGKISSGLLPVNTVLMSSRAPVGYLAIAKIPVAINQGYIAMKCNKELSPEFVLQWCSANMVEIVSRASGTTFAEISKKNFNPIPLVKPQVEIVKNYTKQASAIYSLMENNIREIKSLTQLRDTLLPKLLSGEITLPEAEQAVSEAENV